VAGRGRGRGVRVRAARLHRPRTADGPEDLRIDEVPTPDPGPGEVLVRVHACGVCASDLHVVQGITPAAHLPITLGHEAAGVVEAVGDGVGDWMPGDRVLVPAGRVCGQCTMCLGGRDNLCQFQHVLGVTTDGAQADHALAPGHMLVPVPGSMPFEQAAILADAVATPYHALKRGGITDDMTVAIVGLGGLGMHAVQLAKLTGAHVIGVDVDPVSLERAREWGADDVVDASDGGGAAQVRELTEGGVDRAFEFVGLQATAHDAVKSLRPGGRATLVGISRERLSTLPLGLFVAQELEVVGSFGSTLQDVNELLDLVEAGRLDLSRSVSHVLALDEFPDALRMLETREGNPIRIVVAHAEPDVVAHAD
jgi:D-arabinose 1-dehydrogenase-like Zn-dependent alcohol dehydrogenase